VAAVPIFDTGPMAVEEFYAFTDPRPDEENWDRSHSKPDLDTSPGAPHQDIAANVLFASTPRAREIIAPRAVLPEIRARGSEIGWAESDVMVVPPLGARLDLPQDAANAVLLPAYAIACDTGPA
jgi:hypothetical protein